MKIFKYTLAFAAIALSTVAFSQQNDAKSILDELSEKTRKFTSITSGFTFTLDDQAADVHHSQDGLLKMMGNSYFIKLGENQIFSDGETRWTYSEEMNEVYVDNAEGDENDLNPTQIFTVWETGFKHYYQNEVQEGGKTCHLIKLVPTDPADKSFHTVQLYIDKAKMEIVKIVILGKQGDNFTYDVKNFETNNKYTMTDFTFDPAKYAGVETIDNR